VTAKKTPGDSKKDHPNYFPAEFWTLLLPFDDELYSGFFAGFRPKAKPRPRRAFWQGYRDLLGAAWEHRFGDDEYITRLLSRPIGKSTDPDDEDIVRQNLERLPPSKIGVYPFQHDIIALVREPWRARNCEWQECHKPFNPQ
jgi:hypothetical protein